MLKGRRVRWENWDFFGQYSSLFTPFSPVFFFLPVSSPCLLASEERNRATTISTAHPHHLHHLLPGSHHCWAESSSFLSPHRSASSVTISVVSFFSVASECSSTSLYFAAINQSLHRPHHSLVSASQNQHHLLPVARVCSAPSPPSLPCWVALASCVDLLLYLEYRREWRCGLVTVTVEEAAIAAALLRRRSFCTPSFHFCVTAAFVLGRSRCPVSPKLLPWRVDCHSHHQQLPDGGAAPEKWPAPLIPHLRPPLAEQHL